MYDSHYSKSFVNRPMGLSLWQAFNPNIDTRPQERAGAFHRRMYGGYHRVYVTEKRHRRKAGRQSHTHNGP